MKAVHLLFPDFAFMWLVEEAKKNMPLELDFLNEGRNAEKVAKMLSHYTFLKVNCSLLNDKRFVFLFQGIYTHKEHSTNRSDCFGLLFSITVIPVGLV